MLLVRRRQSAALAARHDLVKSLVRPAERRSMIEVGESGIHGRGAFTTVAVAKGDVFHVAPMMIFDCAQAPHAAKTWVSHYVFYVADCPNDPDCEITALALSPISFVNHARPSNCAFQVNVAAQTISFVALRDLRAGEEVTIDYEDFAERIGVAD